MTDERISTALRAWLEQRDQPPDDPARTAAHVLARLPSVRQRGRWPLPSLWRRSSSVPGTAEPEPSTRGMPVHPLPIITRRTVTMLSPIKAILAGTVVFALGGLLLVGRPLDQQGGVVPGAQTSDSPAVTVTVAQDCVDIFATPIVCDWTASDPRLTGTLTHEWIADIAAPAPDDTASVGWASAILEGAEDSWNGHLYAVWEAEPASQLFVVLSGAGVYEGWQYVASTIDDGEEAGDSEWTGVLYEGELPPIGLPVSAVDQ